MSDLKQPLGKIEENLMTYTDSSSEQVVPNEGIPNEELLHLNMIKIRK